MGGGSLSVAVSSGTTAPSYVQGNPGKFIVVLERTRVDNQYDPSVITKSDWQIVKAVPGTWLTVVAEVGLKWPIQHLHRVYRNEDVQACEPGKDDAGQVDDTLPRYNFFDFEEGGKWEDGVTVSDPPKPAKARDLQVEIDSYWGFKLKEVVVYQKPDLSGDEVLQRRKKMFDFLFEEALALDAKKAMLDELDRLERAAKAIGNSIASEEQKQQELKKLLEELKEKISKKVVDGETAEAIDGWYRFIEHALEETLRYKGHQEERIVKEIQYLKFRNAEYDYIHEGEQSVKKVQKGTPEEDQWKNMPPVIGPPRAPKGRISPASPGAPGSSAPPALNVS
jgi:hypothetical protein